jgi:hypothetical protein
MHNKKPINMTPVIKSYNTIFNLHTSNIIANIRIRHKIIYGAEFGTVYTNANSGEVGAVSAIATKENWSNWIVLAEHSSSISVEIQNSYSNDIMVTSEVEYVEASTDEINSIGIFSTIATIARVYLFGYNLVTPSNNMSNVINDIAGSLPELLNSILEIENNIQNIKNQLSNLDIKIKGVFQEQIAKDAYGDAKDLIAELMPLMKNKKSLEINADEIFNKTLDISVLINRYLRNGTPGGDVATIAIATPLISLYAKIYTYSQRQKMINAGGSPELATSAFDSPLTKKLSRHIKLVNNEFSALKKSNLIARNRVIPKSGMKVYSFDENKGFIPTNIKPWSGSMFFDTGCGSSRGNDFDIDCYVQQVNNHKDVKYNRLFMIIEINGKDTLFGSHWVESTLPQYPFIGHVFSLISDANQVDNHLNLAFTYIDDWKKSQEFFTQKDGLFFKEIQKFEKLLNMVNSKTWEMSKDITSKFKAVCPEHDFESKLLPVYSDAEKELLDHQLNTAGNHSNNDVIEVWE